MRHNKHGEFDVTGEQMQISILGPGLTLLRFNNSEKRCSLYSLDKDGVPRQLHTWRKTQKVELLDTSANDSLSVN